MALSKIKKANKKARHEARRQAKHKKFITENRENNLRYRRSRKILKQGQKEYLARRRQDKAYIQKLMGELDDEQ